MVLNFLNSILSIVRPPNIRKLFPNSKALIISSKFINKAMLKKGNAACVAINGRNFFIIKGALLAAQRANSPLIIEIAKSEGGANAYCAINYWNIARVVDALCNELNISIPIAIHADHYTIKNLQDISSAIIEIPSLFRFGITSFALDASHLPDHQNLLVNIDLNNLILKWSGLETEVGEIKGKLGLSTKNETKFMIQGLNANNIFPDWIAINNGSVHGIESSGNEIDIDLTAEIHNLLLKYEVAGAQHGTSGNSSSKLKELILKTNTTKANVATAVQMIAWGVDVNKYGNAIISNDGNLTKISNRGVSKKLWSNMVNYAKNQAWDINDYKKLNLPFENLLLGQSKEIQDRMSKNVEDFVYNLLINVFNAEGTAEIVLELIDKDKHYCPKHNPEKIEDPKKWTKEKILQQASKFVIGDKSDDDFDD